jgi:hypothetical protein
MLTPAEAAAALNIKEQTLSVWRSARRYDLAYHKIGRLIRYDARAVEKFIQSRQVQPVVADPGPNQK